MADLLRLDLRDGAVDKLAETRRPEAVGDDLGPMRTFGGPPVDGETKVFPIFGSSSALAGGGDPFGIAIGDQSGPIVLMLDEEGVVQQRILLPGERRRPTARDIAQAREEFVDTPSGMAYALQRVGGASVVRDRMPVNSRTPVFRGLAISHDGDLWVERYPLPSDPASLWWIYSRQGDRIRSVFVPRGRRLLAVGTGHYLASARDELDIERVEMWPIEVR